MAVAMETMVQHRTAQVSELKEFLVPKILSVNLKKKSEDRSMSVETSGPSNQQNGGDVNKCPKSTQLIENVQKNLTKILDHEIPSGADLDVVHPAEDDENVIEMASERHRDKENEKQSSYLLQPFLKPVAQHIEGSTAENPILKALFGGSNAVGSPGNKAIYNWISGDRPATNNCHPFKKTELSRDIVNDPTPVQVPKSLSKERERRKSTSPQSRVERGSKSRPESTALKENTHSVNGLETPATAPSATEKVHCVTKSKSTSEKENKPLTPVDVLKHTLSKVPSTRGRISSLSSLKKIGYVNSDKLMKLRTLVDNAIKNHKVYSMTGCYNSVRNALKQRGWIEKIDSDIKGKRRQNRFEEIGIYDAAFQFVQKYPTLAAMRYSIQNHTGFSHNDQINYSGQGEAEIINRMLRNINEDLCWLSRPYPYYCWKDIGKFDLVNRLPKAYFSNKIGLCNSLQHIQWYFEPGVCSTQYPRTYNMSQKDEYEAFKDDFRMTACIGLLKWLTINYRTGGERAVRSSDGKVDACVVDFALKRCTEYVKYREHEDIDLPDGSTVWDYQWDHFITQFYKIINEGHLLKECKSDPSIQVYVTNALAMLNLIRTYWPQINIDGYQNFWVVKPGGRCCGNGIVIKNNLDQILMLVNPTVTRETRYVVQKYIERPLLIYNTKFDIRQWFLVTSVYPLTVWMYRESYLRFCSQPFSLKNTHESIHLCNNAVQRRYKNSKRDRGLPDENMWDCYTFQTYLKSIGHPDAWEKYIYPGMKEGFIGALLASQDTMERRKNCFELYGADFMISDTLTDGPWLIEINSNPAMDSSTSVTARMCPQVLEDIVKVVIDRRDDKNASTGAFEMVFKQHCPPVPPYLGMSLSIKGQKVHRMNAGDPKPFSKKSKSPNSCGKFLQSETDDSQSEDPNESRSNFNYQTQRSENDSLRKLNPRSESQKKVLASQAMSSEVIEGLKKEILGTKVSIKMIGSCDKKESNRYTQLKRQSGEILKVDDLYSTDSAFEGKCSPRRVLSQKLDVARQMPKVPGLAKEERPDEDGKVEDIEIIYGNDVIEIVAPRNMSFYKDTERGEGEIRKEYESGARRDLTAIVESDENINTDDSVHSIYDITPEEFRNDIFKESENEVIEEWSSCGAEICQTVNHVTAIEDIPPVQFLKTLQEKKDSAEDRYVADVEDAEDCNEDKGEGSDATKYIIKEEMKEEGKKNVIIRKPMWKANNRLDYKRRWSKSIKRKKVDYVQKNIEDLRMMQERPRITFKSSKMKSIPHSYVRIAPVTKAVAADSADYEGIYREELLKMLHSMDSKTFIQQLCGKKGKYWNSYLQVKERYEQERGTAGVPAKSGADIFNRDGARWKTQGVAVSNGSELVDCDESAEEGMSEDVKLEIPPICSEIASQLGLKKDSLTVAVLTEGRTHAPAHSGKSSPSLVYGEGRGFSPSSTLIRGKSEVTIKEKGSLPERSNSDLKANIETARRACLDILTKLREFNESNSKVRMQQALRKGNDVEDKVSNALKVYRAAKGFAKGNRKHLSRSQASKGEAVLPRRLKSSGIESLYGVGRIRRKKDDAYVTVADGFCSPKSDSNLAINSENGAVRKVDRTLPKIQQWAFLDGGALKSSGLFRHRRE